METVIKHYNELSADELYEILKLRVNVFVVEQNCPYNELDDKDKNAYHVYMRDENGIFAYLRVLDRGVSYEDVSIGRVISTRRRQGIGTLILKEGIRVAIDKFCADRITISAQLYARGLYEGVGFVQTGGEYLEDDIPHARMELSCADFIKGDN
jgi:ElaA protein